MVSMYHGIETAKRATQVFKKGMEVAGYNTTNADTTGYSRQAATVQATAGLVTTPNVSYLGTGVEITSIERMRDLFLDRQSRRISVEQAYWQTMLTGMTRVDKMIFNINETGLNNLLDTFWTSLEEVHKNPSNTAIRYLALEETDTLVEFSSQLAAAYNGYRDELNGDIKAMVTDVNSMLDQIAVLNKSISAIVTVGGDANALLDRRDLLADEICRLTGAEISGDLDMLDGDYKINLNGKLLIQGTNVKHLVLVENPANNGYYDVQIEYNQYDNTSDPDVAGVVIERRADDLTTTGGSCTTDGVHELDVVRTADELFWTVGCAAGQEAGGDRIDGIVDPTVALGLSGSFALQVGSSGVRTYSEAFESNPPGMGVMLGEPVPGETSEYNFRIAAGDFESTIAITWDSSVGANGGWVVTDNLGHSDDFEGELTVENLASFINVNYAEYGLQAGHTDPNNPIDLILESTDRQLLSVTDLTGGLMQGCGLANDNPIVLIEIDAEDSLQTIANKINNAYKFDNENSNNPYTTVPADTMPSSPEEWLHATVESDGSGGYFLCLTSNVAGEANRINVMSGSVCGGDVNDMNVARRLGLVGVGPEPDDAEDVTHYIQMDRENNVVVTRETGDVYVDDAYVIYDGVEYLSASNAFKDARRIAQVGNALADTLSEMSPGIRFFLEGTGSTTILVQHPLTSGEIFANIKLRDDVLLSQMDTFDDMMYKLATEFNAIHYSGYGVGDYKNITGMAFFQGITNMYGAMGKLSLDSLLTKDADRLAAASGDGAGKSLGEDGSNALNMAQLKQARLFLGGTANFDGLYTNFIAELGTAGKRAESELKVQGYVAEQVENQRKMVMGVNTSEEMLNIVNLTSNFNSASQYLSTLFQVIQQIISGVGRVGI